MFHECHTSVFMLLTLMSSTTPRLGESRSGACLPPRTCKAVMHHKFISHAEILRDQKRQICKLCDEGTEAQSTDIPETNRTQTRPGLARRPSCKNKTARGRARLASGLQPAFPVRRGLLTKLSEALKWSCFRRNEITTENICSPFTCTGRNHGIKMGQLMQQEKMGFAFSGSLP